jgi:hypothetical protein
MHRGYIKLWRRLKDSDIWTKEKFTRGQAWVDLLMLANHKDGFIRKRNIRIDLKRGDLGWSERELADRWKWSRDKVRRFLNELCSENESKLIPQTAPQNKNITSCYHVSNYSLYQDGQTTDCTTDDTTDRPQTDRKQDQNKNVKNDKNDKEKPIVPEWLDLKVWSEYKKYRQNGKGKFTPFAQNLAIKKLEKLKEAGDDPNEVIMQTIECGWSGLFPIKTNRDRKETPEEWIKRVSQE